MKVTPNINYKIKLTKADAKKFCTSIQEYAKTPTQKLKTEILGIYKPYIENKVIADTYGKCISKEDYTQSLYLRLLELIEQVKGRKQKTSNYPSRMLNQISPAKDDIVSRQYSIERAGNEAEEIVNPEEQTAFQKVQDILSIAKGILKQRDYDVLLKRAEGATFERIAALLNTSRSRVEQIYYRAIPKIKANVNRTVLEEAYFDDKNTKRKVITADEPLISAEHLTTLILSKPRNQNFEADMVWKYIRHDAPPIDVVRELDGMLKTQTTNKELMGDRSAQTKLKKKLEQQPDFKFKLKLDRRCDTEEFRQKAEQISITLFGKNVFEFLS